MSEAMTAHNLRACALAVCATAPEEFGREIARHLVWAADEITQSNAERDGLMAQVAALVDAATLVLVGNSLSLKSSRTAIETLRVILANPAHAASTLLQEVEGLRKADAYLRRMMEVVAPMIGHFPEPDLFATQVDSVMAKLKHRAEAAEARVAELETKLKRIQQHESDKSDDEALWS